MTDSVDDAAAAFGANPTLAARAVYLKRYGEAAYLDEMAKWNASPNNLKPGKWPKEYGAEQGDHESNPWSPEYLKKHGKEAAEAEKVRLLRVLGTKGAAGIAAAVGRSVMS